MFLLCTYSSVVWLWQQECFLTESRQIFHLSQSDGKTTSWCLLSLRLHPVSSWTAGLNREQEESLPVFMAEWAQPKLSWNSVFMSEFQPSLTLSGFVSPCHTVVVSQLGSSPAVHTPLRGWISSLLAVISHHCHAHWKQLVKNFSPASVT